MRTFIASVLLFFTSFVSPVQAAWVDLFCKNGNDPSFVQIRKNSDGAFEVETNLTRRFLAGLNCQIPIADQPLFFCRTASDNSLTFSSVLVHEIGFPKDRYDRPVNRERWQLRLNYFYKDGKGEDQNMERLWTFEKSECVWR